MNPPGGAVYFFLIQYQNALEHQHKIIIYFYGKVQHSLFFGRVLANYINFLPVNMSKWPKRPSPEYTFQNFSMQLFKYSETPMCRDPS